MADTYDFDVAVVGSGPAGYVAGIRAAQLGARATVIEKGRLGGAEYSRFILPMPSEPSLRRLRAKSRL